MTFAEIESILDFHLPASARRYQAWWANNPIDGRHSMSWLSAGWQTEDLDLASETVSFRRSENIRTASIGPSDEKTIRSTQKSNTAVDIDQLPHATDGSVSINASMNWKQLGAITLDDDMKLSFPDAPAIPALYRLRLSSAIGTRHYIGEAVNLRRRFGNYRNPGPTQQTSIRINEVLSTHLDAGGEALVDLVVSGINLLVGGQELAVDLTDKAVRRMLEQMAVVANAAIDIESLNR